MGKPWDIGRPCWRIARRSCGNVNLNLASRFANSVSESPLSITTFDNLRRLRRLFAYAANEKHNFLGLGGFDFAFSSPSSLLEAIIICFSLTKTRMKIGVCSLGSECYHSAFCFGDRISRCVEIDR